MSSPSRREVRELSNGELLIDLGECLRDSAWFRQKAKRYHPDRVMHLSEDEREFSAHQFFLSRQAYEKLTAKKTKPLEHLVWVESIEKRESPYLYTIEEYVLLFEANPTNTDVLYNMGWKYFDAGMFDEAIETYERLLAISPEDEDAHYNLRIIRLSKSFDIGGEPQIEGY